MVPDHTAADGVPGDHTVESSVPLADSLLTLSHFVSKRDDCLERFDDRFSIVFLLGFGELIVWHEIGMLLLAIVSPDAVAPTFIKTLPSPVIVVILSQSLHQFLEVGTQRYVRRVNRFRDIGCHHASSGAPGFRLAPNWCVPLKL